MEEDHEKEGDQEEDDMIAAMEAALLLLQLLWKMLLQLVERTDIMWQHESYSSVY